MIAIAAALAVAVGACSHPPAASRPPAPSRAEHWVAAWGAAMQDAYRPGDLGGAASFPGGQARDQTFRTIAHLTGGGTRLRVHLSNEFGTRALTFNAVYAGLRSARSALSPRSNRAVHFAGGSSVTIQPGAQAISDPVDLPVHAGADIAVSTYLAGPTGAMTWHYSQPTTSFFTSAGAGDHAAGASGRAFTHAGSSVFWVSGIDVTAPLGREAGAVVALGDSITDGIHLPPDVNARWTDVLARRLAGRPAGDRLTVVNEGIVGNRLVGRRSAYGPPATWRLGADALEQAGALALILAEGINDVYAGESAPSIEGAMLTIARRAHQAGLRVLVATLTPTEGSAGLRVRAGERARTRAAVNSWIRSSHAFDGVLDFDAVLRDPSNPSRLDPRLDSGDHIHPDVRGARALGESVSLGLLSPAAGRRQ